MKSIKRIWGILVSLCLLFAFFIFPTSSHAQGIDTTEGMDLGPGAIGIAQADIRQRGVKEQGLAAVKKWRLDALNDSRVRLNDYTWYTADHHAPTIRELLPLLKISESEYLNPKWDYGLERVAIQRAVESADAWFGHNRYNGDTWDISYKGNRSNGEVLLWGRSTISSAVDRWASEKNDLLSANGAETGHYIFLINPSARSYGFGGAFTGGSRWAGRCSNQSPTNESSTNWQGTLNFQIRVADEYYNTANVSPWKIELNEGDSTNVSLSHMLGQSAWGTLFVNYQGTLESGDTNIATVQGNTVTAKNAGSTWVAFNSDGHKRYIPVEVKSVPFNVQLTWYEQDEFISAGAAVSDKKYDKYEYLFQSYNVNTKKWRTFADWSSSNWTDWADDMGTYWLHVEVRDKATKKVIGTNTIAFAHRPGKHRINGTYAGTQADGSVLLGVSNTNPRGYTVIKIYDTQKKTWVAQFPGPWATWKPTKGIYWTHYELYTSTGELQDVRTYAFEMK